MTNRAAKLDPLPLYFREADEDDVNAIVSLVNLAYRGEPSRRGWTTEADLLGGQRTDSDQIRRLFRVRDSLIFLGYQADELVGCVHLSRSGHCAWLGMFAVNPDLQGRGIGKRFISMAEKHAQQQWGCFTMLMTVISRRSDVIAFYERLGYRATGNLRPFPSGGHVGVPKVGDLKLSVMGKDLGAVIDTQQPSMADDCVYQQR